MKNQLQLIPKPKSIEEISIAVFNGHDYSCAVKEFIDVLIKHTRAPASKFGYYSFSPSFFSKEPHTALLQVHLVHLAGLAENLALLSGVTPPIWTEEEQYFLKVPSYIGGKHSRASVIASTGSSFRRRLLFCGPSLTKFYRLRPRPSA